MRIGLICYGLDCPFKGIGRYILELSKVLALQDEPLELFLLTPGGSGPLGNKQGFQ